MIVPREEWDDSSSQNQPETINATTPCAFGKIAYQPSPNTLVGAIGCASQVLLGNRRDGLVVQPPEDAAVSSMPPPCCW